uniref:Uncharacterized protein n=1 Tax=Timema genevievae TaxID=629358 RepID=A0A7R9K1F2_TIMGE|nr:unnamed protein product [Timema genevievae]
MKICVSGKHEQVSGLRSPANLLVAHHGLHDGIETSLGSVQIPGHGGFLNFTLRRKTNDLHPTEIRTSISPSSAVELNMTGALANYATEAESRFRDTGTIGEGGAGAFLIPAKGPVVPIVADLLGTVLVNGMTTLSTKLPKPSRKLPVMLCMAAANLSPNEDRFFLSSSMEAERSISVCVSERARPRVVCGGR